MPVAAGDDQSPFISPTVTPRDYFADYQKAQIALLLNPCAANSSYTIPLVVYGAPARAVFAELFGVSLDVNQAAQLCALVEHEGSLFYPTGNAADFTFKISLEQGASFCSANGNNPCASSGQATRTLPTAAASPASGVRG